MAATRAKFETFTRRPLLTQTKRYYFRFVAPNGETMLQSEAYNSKQSRDDAVMRIRQYSLTARVVEVDK